MAAPFVLEWLSSGLGIALWSACFWRLGRLPLCEQVLRRSLPYMREQSEMRLWLRFADAVLGLEQTLRSGWVPSEAQWAALGATDEPPGITRSREALLSLRDRGVALLPALGRTRELALFIAEGLRTARARALPALTQSALLVFSLPLASLALYRMLPELEQSAVLWWTAAGVLWAWMLSGSLWMRRRVAQAARGDLLAQEAALPLALLLAMESLRSALESGHPPDLAWVQLRTLLAEWRAEWSAALPPSLFSSAQGSSAHGISSDSGLGSSAAAQALFALVRTFHRSMHWSVMEGRPCSERATHDAQLLRQQIQEQRDRAFGRLPARLLLPLVLCGALPWLVLLGAALSLTGLELLGASTGASA